MLRRVSAFIALTLLALTAPTALAQVNPLDAERGNLARERYRVLDEIRRSHFAGEYERVLELCDELDAIDPNSQRAEYYRREAQARLNRQEAQEPLPERRRFRSLPVPDAASAESEYPEWLTDEEVRNQERLREDRRQRALQLLEQDLTGEAPGEDLPPPAPMEQVMQEGPQPVAEVAEPQPLSPIPSQPPPAPLTEREIDQADAGTMASPGFDSVPADDSGGASEAGASRAPLGVPIWAWAAGGVVLLLVVIRLARRRRRDVEPEEESAAPQAMDEESSASWDPVGEITPPAPSDSLYEMEAVEPTAPRMAAEATPSAVGLDAGLSQLAQPWGSVDEAVEAIRLKMQTPLAKREEPKPEPKEAEIPLSLEGLAPRSESIDYELPGAAKGSVPARDSDRDLRELLAREEPLGSDSVEAANTDPMMQPNPFGGPSHFESGPEDLGFEQPEEPDAPSIEFDNPLDEFETQPTADLPVVESEEEPAPMTTDDVLEASLPPSKVIPASPAETTAPPLSLDDLLGAAPPVKPEKAKASGPPVREEPEEERSKPEKDAKGFDPELLEETIALPLNAPQPERREPRPKEEPAPPAPGLEDLERTQTIDPKEMRRILRQVQELNPDEIDTISEELEKKGVPADEQLFQQYYRQGLNALEGQEWPRAVQLFKLALDMRPDSSEVLQRLRRAQEGLASPQGSSGGSFTPGL